MCRSLCLLPVLAVLIVACTRPAPKPADVTIVREYGWDATVDVPNPIWNPGNYQVLVRSASGFAILDEGRGRQEYFVAKDKREFDEAAWVDVSSFVIGPARNVITTDDGHVVPSTDGLQLIKIFTAQANEVTELGLVGYRPRPWKDRIVAQVEDRIVVYTMSGSSSDFGRGFFAEPQRHGEGLAWQETPVYQTDHWTAKPALSDLVIRWAYGSVSTIPRAIAPRWTAGGGIIAYQLDREPPTDAPWWDAVPARLVHLPRKDAELTVLGEDLRHADPHPAWPMIAANDAEGRVVLVSLQDGSRRVLAEFGDKPRWSADGARLLVQELKLVGTDAGRIYIRVYVLTLPKA